MDSPKSLKVITGIFLLFLGVLAFNTIDSIYIPLKKKYCRRTHIRHSLLWHRVPGILYHWIFHQQIDQEYQQTKFLHQAKLSTVLHHGNRPVPASFSIYVGKSL